MYNYTNLTQNTQLATAYAVYEIIGSEFKKCSYRNFREEDKLHINFSFENNKSQEALEAKVIKVLENMNINVSDLKAEVFGYYNSDRNYVMYFKTYVTDVIATIDSKGRFQITVKDY